MDSIVNWLALLASLLVIFLIGREVMCWYWKINRIIMLLESIDAKLTPRDAVAVETAAVAEKQEVPQKTEEPS